jgi:phage major head subunit gpT-like protein
MSAQGLSSRAIIGSFYNRLEQNGGAAWIGALSMLFQSDQESETYKWLGMAPQMREWVGGRNAKGFRENGITIENLLFEATIEVLVREMKRDKTGQVLLRINELADRTNAHWAKLLSTLIINAESSVCYDGQYFFDTDHSEGDSGAQSNDITVDISALPANQHGAATAPSAEEMEQVIFKGVQQILSFVDDQGEPMNENANQFLVMAPVSLMKPVASALKDTTLESGKTNTLLASGFSLTPAYNQRLSSWTDKIAIFRADGQTKPFIRQEEEEVSLSAIAEGSELEFKENKHQYGVEASRNVGYGYWQHGCLVQMT